MPPDGAARRREDFSGDCSRDAPGNCDEHTPIHPYPRLTSGQSLHSCALAHTGRVLVPQQTQNGPPSVASRKYEPPVRCPARAPLGSHPLSITPTSFNATRRPRLGKPRVVAHCRWQGRTRRPHTRSGRARTARGGSLPDSRPPTRRTRARQPARLAVATTPRAVIAVARRPPRGCPSFARTRRRARRRR